MPIADSNTVDVTTVAKVKEELKGWQLSRCVFVGDAGMVSKANLETLARGGGKYIVCMPIHRGGEVAADVVTRPGRYQKVAENLEVKEVTVGDGERRRRYVVCYNPQEAERQRKRAAKSSCRGADWVIRRRINSRRRPPPNDAAAARRCGCSAVLAAARARP
jgi:transposase